MKASELRIGNIIFSKQDQCERTVGLIGQSNELSYSRENTSACDSNGGICDATPIQLTEEWMEKFGFTYNDLNGDSGHWQKLPFELLQGEDGFSYKYYTEVKSVHQLQNLYFALTGEELIMTN